MKKLVRIFDFYYNVDNIVNIEPNYKTDVDSKEKKEIGCTIWYNVAMSSEVFHNTIILGIKNGKPTHTTAEVVDHLNRSEDFDD